MKPLPLLLLCLVAGAFCLARPSRAAEPKKLLLARVQASAERAALARSIEDSLLAELGKRQGFVVVSPAELEQVLAFAKTQAELGCDEIERCVASIKDKLHADLLIYAKLVPVGKGSVLSLTALKVGESRVIKRVATEESDPQALRSALGPLLDELLGLRETAAAFRLNPAEPLRLAIMPLAAHGVSPSLADAMTQILAAEYHQIEGVSVLSRDDIRVMLNQVDLELQLGCLDDLRCVVEIGAALGLSRLITGSIAEVGGTHVVSLRLIDTRAASVLSRAVEPFEGDAKELPRAVKLAGYALLGLSLEGKRGAVAWTFNVARGKATLGPHHFAIGSHQLNIDQVPSGRHSLWVVPDDTAYLPLRTDVYVAPGLDSVRSFELTRAPERWYQRWWVWAIAGTVVTAATTTVILLQTRDDTGTFNVDLPAGTATEQRQGWAF
jgi:hypothetical protein